MIKLFSLICWGLLAFASCNKSNNADDTSSTSGSLTKINTSTPAIVTQIDTVAPANAVNAKSLGVMGNGVNDDTDALQKLINSQTDILLPAGTYVINKTLNMRANVKIYGRAGATITTGTQISGTLLTNGRYFYFDNADNCLLYNITFKKSSQSFSLSNWANACIYVSSSKGTNILYNTFNFNFGYTKTGLEAAWFTGAGTANSIIKGNNLYTVGIEYAEAGAGSALVEGNYIKNAHSVALDAHGNTDTYCMNNTINNNTIENPGYIGIEDWGNTSGTVIKNNTVSHTGQDPTQGTDGMGISAVGQNPQILNNVITDATLYYIELAGGTAHLVDSNIINDTRGLATGIITNYTSTKNIDNSIESGKVTITNNQINNCAVGVSYYGNNNINTLLQSNKFTNPKTVGVSIDSDAPIITADFTNNSLSFTLPTSQTRYAFQTYTRLAPTANVKHTITYNGNTIVYTTAAKSGTGTDYGFFLATNNTTITANIIQSSISTVKAIGNTTGNTLNLNFTKNRFSGVTADFSKFNLLSNTDNVITK
ncbi:MAG: right-handed parallel beta-helix repeat-containing protein [Mucilaginibacter sp.]